jgi:CYTH domain-containing protein
MVENEVKYILKIDAKFDTTGWDAIAIEQHYLPNSVRIRRSSFMQDSTFTINYKSFMQDSTFTMNHKSLRSDNSYNELEYDIDVQVFNLLKRQQSLASIKKTRFTKLFGDELWAIDLLATGPAWTTYFVLAECEMPENRESPLRIPMQITDNLLFAVPREETTLYSNYRLADVGYARAIYESAHYGS